MKKLTLLLLIFASFSCAPTMESDVEKACEITTELMSMVGETMTLTMESLSGDADSKKAATDKIADLTAKTVKMEEELLAIQERNKENWEAFTDLLMENCDILQ